MVSGLDRVKSAAIRRSGGFRKPPQGGRVVCKPVLQKVRDSRSRSESVSGSAIGFGSGSPLDSEHVSNPASEGM